MTTENKSNNNRTWLIAAVIAALIGLNIYLYFQINDKDKTIGVQQESIQVSSAKLDDTRAQLDSLDKELKHKIEEVQKLGGDTASLGEIRRNLLVDLKAARGARASDVKKVAALKQKLEEYRVQLVTKDEEIVKLREERDQFFTDNKNLKGEIVKQSDSLNKVSAIKKELDGKVAIASRLKAENLKITIIDTRGKEKEDDVYKLKKVDKVKVTFSIADNPVAKIENKEVILRLIEPDGATLSDAANGGGSFMADGKGTPYTAKQSFLFDNKMPKISFTFAKGSAYKAGDNMIELYVEGTKIGEAKLTLK